LFCPINKSGKVSVARRLSELGVRKIVKKRASEAGIKDVTPFDLRNTHLSELLNAGVDFEIVQRLAGHNLQVSTLHYNKRLKGNKGSRSGPTDTYMPRSQLDLTTLRDLTDGPQRTEVQISPQTRALRKAERGRQPEVEQLAFDVE
jgi:hypothetical protein